MRLSINGWPPIASHVACILIGGALTNLSGSDTRPDDPTLSPARKAMLNFKPEELQLIDTHQGEPGFVARRTDNDICLIAKTKLQITSQSSRIQLFGSIQAFPAIAAAALEAGSGKLAIIGANSAKNYRPCDTKPKVNYGTP